MSFLIFNDKTQGVEISKEIKNLNEILLLKENDKSKNKTYFNDCLKYIYHTYKKEHPFYNIPINERKVKVSEIYLDKQDYKKFDEDILVQGVIKLYISLEYSQNEWTYQTIKNNISDIKKDITNIPMTKKAIIDQSIEVKFSCEECGVQQKQTVKIKQEVDVDNSKERMDALRRIFELEEMEQKFKDLIIKERKIKEHNTEMSLLEQKFFDEA